MEDTRPAPDARASRRDRRGRGLRGPAALGHPDFGRPPRPFARRESFDNLVLDIVTDIDARWSDRLGLVEYAVEDTPQVPDDWDPGSVPLSSLVRGSGTTATRLVVFRRPLEHRAADRGELEAMVLTVIVEQVAELLGIPPSEVDSRYPDDLD